MHSEFTLAQRLSLYAGPGRLYLSFQRITCLHPASDCAGFRISAGAITTEGTLFTSLLPSPELRERELTKIEIKTDQQQDSIHDKENEGKGREGEGARSVTTACPDRHRGYSLPQVSKKKSEKSGENAKAPTCSGQMARVLPPCSRLRMTQNDEPMPWLLPVLTRVWLFRGEMSKPSDGYYSIDRSRQRPG